MSGIYGTNFLESEAVLAMAAGDLDVVDQQLGQMSLGELRAYVKTLESLANRARGRAWL